MIRSAVSQSLCLFVSIALLNVGSAAASTKPICDKDVAQKLARSVVSITHMFEPSEVRVDPESGESITGIQATAWLIEDRQTLVTIEHVAEAMGLDTETWRTITVSWSKSEYEAPSLFFETRARLVDSHDEANEESPLRIALEDELPHRLVPARVRDEPLGDGDPVVAVGYTHGALRLATGTLNYPEPNPDAEREAEPSSYLPFELADQDKNDRLAIDHGASGGPIADCEGRVAAVFVQVLTQDKERSEALDGMTKMLEALSASGYDLSAELGALDRLSTSWGLFNAYGAVPIFLSR